MEPCSYWEHLCRLSRPPPARLPDQLSPTVRPRLPGAARSNEGASYDREVVVPGVVVDMEALRELCGRYGVARLEVFGSASRGGTTTDSDLDRLYELAPGSRLGWNIETLADELSDLFGRRVDLVARNALHERLR